jgi:hypothetical protein
VGEEEAELLRGSLWSREMIWHRNVPIKISIPPPITL